MVNKFTVGDAVYIRAQGIGLFGFLPNLQKGMRHASDFGRRDPYRDINKRSEKVSTVLVRQSCPESCVYESHLDAVERRHDQRFPHRTSRQTHLQREQRRWLVLDHEPMAWTRHASHQGSLG